MALIQAHINNGYNANDLWGSRLIYLNEEILRFSIEKFGANVNHIFETEKAPFVLGPIPFIPGKIKGSINTPLATAIWLGSPMAVKVLLDAGANINQKINPYPDIPNYAGLKTPLAFSIDTGRTVTVGLLIARGANLE